MSESSEQIGRRYPAVLYAVGREKIREFARAVGETNPLYLDLDAARAAGYSDLVAPPMFSVVYCAEALMAPFFDPELGIDFGRLVHGAQKFEWSRTVVAGEEISTSVEVLDIKHQELTNLTYFIFGSDSLDSSGNLVAKGTWTNIVRGEG